MPTIILIGHKQLVQSRSVYDTMYIPHAPQEADLGERQGVPTELLFFGYKPPPFISPVAAVNIAPQFFTLFHPPGSRTPICSFETELS